MESNSIRNGLRVEDWIGGRASGIECSPPFCQRRVCPPCPMPHTPLLGRLRAAFHLADTAVRSNHDPGQVMGGKTQHSNRREFLGRAAGLAGALALAPNGWTRPPKGVPDVRVAVVGAGLAGLTCAYRLRQSGIRAKVFEANTRLGGRCWTIRGAFAESQIAEHGGELIDQGHTRIRKLAQELRLPLDNLLASEVNGTEAIYYLDGAPYTIEEAINDFKLIWRKLHRDLSQAGYPTQFDRYTPRGLELDRMSIVDWIEETVPGGIQSRLGRLLDVAYTIEYGADCGCQSSLNLLYLLAYLGPGQLRLFGTSNEKYHVRGGNDQIPAALAATLESQIVTGSALVAVVQNADGTYTLTLDEGQRRRETVADQVVLALPFSILNQSVDLSRAGFSPLKRTAIRELAMGSNSKLNVQFSRRGWIDLGNNGDTYSDTGYQATWEVSRGQAGASGILVDYTGGPIADTFGRGTPAQRTAQFLSQLDPVLPGAGSTWNGRATVDFWASNPYQRGSYSYWQVGQYTRFAGIEGRPDGACHFCGEHTSVDAQGYLEGAVETGERAAAEVVDAIGI